MKESTAMQIGRDDYRLNHNLALSNPLLFKVPANPTAPFPQGSQDAAEWLEGWTQEEMLRRNPNSKAFQRQLSSFQKVKKIMSGE